MYKIRTLNNIAKQGLDRFPRDSYEVNAKLSDPDAILIRSHELTRADATPSLRAVGRAGAGVNNIPVAEYTEQGIVVFNTPGANANAVKELVLVGMLLSCRGIISGIDYVNGLQKHKDKEELNRLVEANKKQYKGRELKGRTLGVLGLGAVGSMVADMALQMDMNVLGYDPALSVESAWRLSSQVKKMDSMQALLSRSDMVTLHVPVLETTREMINQESLGYIRQGAVLLNFSREEIVAKDAVLKALENGRLSQYISDFPTPGLIGKPGLISMPHLGASTEEAEVNCAMMVADQVRDFLENGNIKNSVNFPTIELERTDGVHRIALANKNVPRILGKVLAILSDKNINVVEMLNKSRDEVAYNLIDIETIPTDEIVADIFAIDGVINVRIFEETG